MKNILDDLKKYLANATQEELDKDWDELKDYNKIGPEVSAFCGQCPNNFTQLNFDENMSL